MKDYKQFIKQLPSSTIVCAVGEFNPPTTAHELLIQTAKVVAEQKSCDHIIFTTPSDTLQEDKKQQYLKLLFPTSNFISIGESFFATVVKKLNEKYKNVIIIAGADQLAEFKKLKESSDEFEKHRDSPIPHPMLPCAVHTEKLDAMDKKLDTLIAGLIPKK